MKRILLHAGLVAFAACATTSATKTDAKAAPKGAPVMEKMAVSNVLPFDLAACGPRAGLDLSAPTQEMLLGALLSLDPAFSECFVDASSVDGAALAAVVKLTVGETVEAEATGTGLTASGKACLVAAMKKLPLKPLEKGAKALTAEKPVAPAGKSVKMGINPASDAVGLVRLAQPSLCECYAEVGAKPAPTLTAKLLLSKTKPAEVLLDPTEAATVATCVGAKLKDVKFPVADVTVAYLFLLKNSYATEVTESAQPALQFQQFDGMRAQRTADVLMSAGKRGVAASAYDAVVEKYKKTKSPSLIAELRTKCAAVVGSDDGWAGSIKALVATYDSTLTLVKDEKAKDAAAWGPVEQKLTEQRTGAAAELTRVEGQKKADENACPKSK
jgi:hypothetical protein